MSKRGYWIMGGVAAAVLALFVGTSVDFPASGDKAAGTIVPAERVRNTQPGAADVKLVEPSRTPSPGVPLATGTTNLGATGTTNLGEGGTTNLGAGGTTQDFESIGSRLDLFPVAYGVAGSAAFPGAFHYLTLRNYSKPDEKFIHLMDGGVMGNLGIRVALEDSPDRRRGPLPQRPGPCHPRRREARHQGEERGRLRPEKLLGLFRRFLQRPGHPQPADGGEPASEGP